ncbi:MAG: sigma-70 family RNA polymerase sigma factor [Planctomycetes bacterium]|nr:sigma-70 family RNA polymerase sigma factor [Planctomycetota bacterium]
MNADPKPPSEPGSPVAALLRRWFEARDPLALDELVRRNLDHLQGYAHGKLSAAARGKADTGDVVQEALRSVLAYHPPFVVETEAQLRGLLRKIVDGVLSDQHRRWTALHRDVAREHPLPDGTSVAIGALRVGGESPSAAARGHEREAESRLAIATLDPTDQVIVIMRVYRDEPFDAIGREVGMKPDTARVRFRRAMRRLSEKLKALRDGDTDTFLA